MNKYFTSYENEQICGKHQVASITSCHAWQYGTILLLNLAVTKVAEFLPIFKQGKIPPRNEGLDQSIYLYHGISELGNLPPCQLDGIGTTVCR